MVHAAHSTREREREREMSSHHRFKLSHLMPNSWFYKLRDMKRPRPSSQRSSGITRTSKRSVLYNHGTTTPKPLPLSPHHYPSKTKGISMEQLRPSPLHLNPKATGIQFPRDHHQHHHGNHQSSLFRKSNGVAIEDDYDFQELQLRPIRTRPEPTGSTSAHSTISSGTCPNSPRLRSRRLHIITGGMISTTSASRRRSVARKSFAIVKASTDPTRDFRESMVEMIVENDVHAPEDLQELLECYLSLNSRAYHGVITEVFRRIWLEIFYDIV